MGYCITLVDSNFFIDNKNNVHREIVKNIKSILLSKESPKFQKSKYSWVDDEDIEKSKTIGDILEAFRYSYSEDCDGNIFKIFFDGEKLGDDKELFSILSPYIKEDSYLNFRGEDGCLWKWFFKNGHLKEKQGKIVFED